MATNANTRKTTKATTKVTAKTKIDSSNSELESRIKKLESRCAKLEKANSSLKKELKEINNSNIPSVVSDIDNPRIITQKDWDRLKQALRAVSHPSVAADLI